MSLPIAEIIRGYKADVGRPARGTPRFRFEFVTRSVQVDFLCPEPERRSTSFEADNVHAHYPPIEIASCPNILHGEDEMIDRMNPENLLPLLHVRPQSP